MIHFLSPSWLKKADRFSKGVKKFIAYQRDLIPEDRLVEVNEAKSAYDAALKAKDRQALDGLEKKLLKVCEGAVPNYSASPLKENVEVIIVAVIVALGIRAYYLQPFKIPTASMQPTLNGIIATRLEGDAQSPNFLLQGLQYVWNGRNYVEVKVPGEWGETELVEYRQYSRLNFFTFTELKFSNQQTLKAYAPAKQLLGEYITTQEGRRDVVGMWRDGTLTNTAMNAGSDDTNGWVKLPSQKVKGGDILARGFVESGDQLLVDKVSYHFRRPHRDDVFVFSTENIAAIGKNQHYIKRLVALPGDQLRVEEPDLFINGVKTTGPGSLKVMKQEGGYGGYTTPRGNAPGGNFVDATGHTTKEVTLPPKGYMAMGDNSANSYDSRNWGPVPERNVVGPALFVYWPFANHWGIIR